MTKLKSHRTEEDHAFDVAVGARIRRFRQAVGMSQSVLAESAGITFQQLRKYENGSNRVAVSRLAAMARTLLVPASVLLGETEEPAHLLTGGQRNWLALYDRITPQQRDLVIRMFGEITRVAA